MEDIVLTLEETAAILKVSMDTMYQLVKIKEFPAVKIGREWRAPENEVDLWILRQIKEKRERHFD